jgi:hypothetical protein
MKRRNALQEIMQQTTEELSRLSPEEKEQLQTDALKQFGLPPLATLRIWAREAVIFSLIGALLVAIAALSPMAGLRYGLVVGFSIWIVYRLFRFALA